MEAQGSSSGWSHPIHRREQGEVNTPSLPAHSLAFFTLTLSYTAHSRPASSTQNPISSKTIHNLVKDNIWLKIANAHLSCWGNDGAHRLALCRMTTRPLHLLTTERALTEHKKYNEPCCRITLHDSRKTAVSGRSGSISGNSPLGSADLQTRGCPAKPGCDLGGRSFQIWVDMEQHQRCLLGPGLRVCLVSVRCIWMLPQALGLSHPVWVTLTRTTLSPGPAGSFLTH